MLYSGPAASGEKLGGATASPYAKMMRLPVKALSNEQVADLHSGRGMGLALAAELNGYPGPLHALELSDQLQLINEQRGRAKDLVSAMKAETIAIEKRLISHEAKLDKLFAGRRATPPLLKKLVSRFADSQGELRAAHLRYHLSMIQFLMPAQINRYAELRGYNPVNHDDDFEH